MEEVIIVEDRVDMQCVRHVHLMSNGEFERTILRSYNAPNGIVTQESRVWHFRCSYPYRGMIDIPAACAEGKVRRLVAWSLSGCPSVKVALHNAVMEYERIFGGRAGFGFIRRLPRSAFSDEQSAMSKVVEVGDLTLLEAEWMLERCVAVGGMTPPLAPPHPSTAAGTPPLRMERGIFVEA